MCIMITLLIQYVPAWWLVDKRRLDFMVIGLHITLNCSWDWLSEPDDQHVETIRTSKNCFLDTFWRDISWRNESLVCVYKCTKIFLKKLFITFRSLSLSLKTIIICMMERPEIPVYWSFVKILSMHVHDRRNDVHA